LQLPRTSTESLQIIPILGSSLVPKKHLNQRVSLAFYGLNAFPFLSQEFITALKELLDAHANILSIHSMSANHDVEFAQSVSPEVYSHVSNSSNKRKCK
jgi:hypothetical protein